MILSCSCSDDYEFYFYPPQDYSTLNTKQRRKCCSCGKLINKGEIVGYFFRYRMPHDEPPYIEERIYGDEVPLAPWFMCEGCVDQFFNLSELGFCVSLGENMLDLLEEYQDLEYRKRYG